jgi:plasmid stability protein
LLGDKAVFRLPEGFSLRLRKRLATHHSSRD